MKTTTDLNKLKAVGGVYVEHNGWRRFYFFDPSRFLQLEIEHGPGPEPGQNMPIAAMLDGVSIPVQDASDLLRRLHGAMMYVDLGEGNVGWLYGRLTEKDKALLVAGLEREMGKQP